MGHYKFVVFTNPVEGKEDEYNAWYSDVHLGEVIGIDGFVSAQRFRFVDTGGDKPATRYMAVYEIEADDPKKVLENLMKKAMSGGMVTSDALDAGSAKTYLYTPITDRVAAK